MDKRTWPNLKTGLTDAWRISWKTATTLLPVLALLLTVLSVAATHKHNRLSVIPKLSFDWDTASDDVIGLSVENSGAGPAVIKSFAVENFKAFSDNQISDEEPVRRVFFRTYFFQQGARSRLITIERSKVRDVGSFRDLIEGKVLVTIEYCSIYGDCWKECSNIKDPTCGYHRSPAEDIFNASVWSKVL
jgi:hypothetical protein